MKNKTPSRHRSVRLPLDVDEALRLICDRTQRDRTSVLVDALRAGLPLVPVT